ncbi:MAG: molybdopterin-dependent oxidoreductase [Thermoanaerobacteraceae bacterium]|nr:molybdopterin-dependent oxidoreductase [Thermoanaerobacteraceae bacterium]
MAEYKSIGINTEKRDAMSLVTGQPVFTDDIALKDMLHIKMMHSPYPHATIEEINTEKAEGYPGVLMVLTYKNTPRVIHTTAGQGWPEPSPYDTYMFNQKMRFVGDRVAAVVAESEEAACEALKLIEVKYNILQAVLDPHDSMRDGVPVIHDEPEIKGAYDPQHNLAANIDIEIGDINEELKKSAYVIEDTIRTQYVQLTPIEPHVTISYLDEYGRIVIRTSTQVPFHVRRIVAQVLDIPVRNIRVIKPRTGGGFGTKQEIILEDICAYATLKTGRPVRAIYTREEELMSTRTRHPMEISLKIGAGEDGLINAISMHILSNTGAYGAHGLTVASNSGSKSLPLYNKAKAVQFRANIVYTNLPVAGANRGYGAPQAYAALEQVIDELAYKTGIGPLEFRKKNHIRTGETSPIFKALGEGKEGVEQYIQSCALDELIDRGAQEIGWYEKFGKHIRNGSKVRGVGMAMLMQGSAIPMVDMGAATIKMNEDGSFNLMYGGTDLGTGLDTVSSQIVAETLGVKPEDIIVYASDTDITPFDVGAYASSGLYISGSAALKAAMAVRDQIFEVAKELLGEVDDKNFILEDGRVISKASGKSLSLSEIAHHTLYVSNQHQIIASASMVSPYSPPPFAVHFAEIEVDGETGVIKPIKYVAAMDCGKPINPELVKGQIIGAVSEGLGYALTEEYVFDENGKMLNGNLTDYKIFSTRDMPEVVPIIVETYEPTGPYGAKSAAEININGPAPAIANALYDAIGIRVKDFPLTPEKVLREIKNK